MRAWRLAVLLPWLAACPPASDRPEAGGPPRGSAAGADGALPSALAHAAVAAAAGAPSGSAAPAAAAPPRVDNVVLLTIDSLRADQPWVGYPHVKTPHLSALAARSTVY